MNQTSGRTSYMCVIKIENPPEDVKVASDIFFFLNMVNEGDSDKGKEFMLLQQRRFFEAFSIPYEASGFDPDDIPGATASNIHVTLGEYEDKPKNELNLPPAPAGEVKGTAKPKRRRG